MRSILTTNGRVEREKRHRAAGRVRQVAGWPYRSHIALVQPDNVNRRSRSLSHPLMHPGSKGETDRQVSARRARTAADHPLPSAGASIFAEPSPFPGVAVWLHQPADLRERAT